jgi:hypothetical protein
MDLTNYWGFLMKALNRKLQCYTAIEGAGLADYGPSNCVSVVPYSFF